ncbi:adenylate/guanylate cyclase domain-containing protein [Aporhodopirellula aestuarii]|uniref:Adenylate/guanylate cyclase domain-containing protein n=1 Tax=Aporhodopirellula aestuarii TaxID=2950107 RepID=A0ABT0U4A2_9BACT|nr:adenylate/guanylate cyclase domain-containing protein [Aporhodopirellula aestuarii]MCM2371258.1 adenylate/guanylate cyclase domain-containing protein [Aporhodopirellula aestuarii]
MSSPVVDVTLWQGQQECWIGESGLPLEIGRQSREEENAILRKVQDLGNQYRIAIAPITSLGLPRHALSVSMTSDGKLEVKNLHARSTFQIASDPVPVMPKATVQHDREFTILLPENLIVKIVLCTSLSSKLSDSGNDFGSQGSASFRTISPDSKRPLSPNPDLFQADFTMPMNPGASFIRTFTEDSNPNRGHAAVDLVRQALAVVKKSAGSDEFFDTAVKSVAGMIELDRAYVLMREDDSKWWVRAHYDQRSSEASESGLLKSGLSDTDLEHRARSSNDETVEDSKAAKGDSASSSTQRSPRLDVPLPSGSRLLLQRVLQKRETVMYEPESYKHTIGSSIMLLDRAVASPIFDEHGAVIGALYGDRSYGTMHADTPIGDLEATLLEVMAGAVSAGIGRQRQEAIQASMTQFFSPAITQRLQQNEDLLTGRDAEVSVLFCDIRGFSAITERVGPEKTIEWINDVLTQLSLCVTRTDGVLVDYVGDELMAMWGAPAEQPDHARRACSAACRMLKQIEPLRERWKEITPERFGVGIGINTGMARVGNTGSRVKFKYGPLGNTVNIASRVQGITKKFGVSALITKATCEALARTELIHPVATGDEGNESECDQPMQTRRLADVRPLGVKEIVEIYELHSGNEPAWRAMADRYESALRSFHHSDLTAAARELASLVHEHPGDTPSVVLLGRVVDAITNQTKTVNPVMEMQSK